MPNPGTGYTPDVEIWDGNAIFVPGITPFGFYDEDRVFATDAVKVAKFCATRLGWPMMDVELQSGSFFAAFEEAVTTYGNTVYAWKVRENYLSLEGGSTEIKANEMVLEPSLQRIVEIAKNYGTEAEVGGNVTLHTGLLELKPGIQDYDLEQWAKDQGIDGGIEIRKIFYEAPPAILRYFDPYAGTGTGIQSLMDAFDFGSYSPGVNFLLMPVSADILKIQAIEFNDQVRRSAYSFRIVNNRLTIFPIPTQGGILRIEYYKMSDKRKLNTGAYNYVTLSIARKDITASGGDTVFTSFEELGISTDPDEVHIQFYVKDKESLTSEEMMMFPATIITDRLGIYSTFTEDFDGAILVSYPTYQTAVDGTVYCKYSANFELILPEGQERITQKIIHTLNTEDVNVQVYEEVGGESRIMLPEEIIIVNPHEIQLVFTASIKGRAVLTSFSEISAGESNIITNVSEVPYENPTYSKINSIGKQWIFRYTLALVKEMLAYVRGKYTTVPIPDSDATLNQQDLLSDARTEKEKLIEELNTLLESTSRQSQLERKAQEAEYLQKTLGGVPMCIFVG